MPSRSGSAKPIVYDVVHRAEQIDDLLVAPVGEDRLLVGAAAAVAAAVVDGDDHVAVGREQLALEAERVLVLAVRAAVDAQQRRILAPGTVVGGLTIRPWTSVPSLLVDAKSSVVPSARRPATRRSGASAGAARRSRARTPPGSASPSTRAPRTRRRCRRTAT